MQIVVVLDAQLFYAPEVDGAGAAVGTVYGVALVEQQLRKVCAVLACDTGDDGSFHVVIHNELLIIDLHSTHQLLCTLRPIQPGYIVRAWVLRHSMH